MSPDDLIAEAKAQINEMPLSQLDQGDAHDLIVIDVREPHEYADGHIPGAINIPRGVIEFNIGSHPRLKACTAIEAMPIVVYCRSGGRSALAAQSLQRIGFTHIHSLAGGIVGWTEAGRAVRTGDAP